jgi:L-alanine-DL-glutamate epimerase-like enolase superfamily enzyme
LYSVDAFAEFIGQQAVHWLQPDVTRMAGLTDVLRVIELAAAHRLPVLEYIPWIRDCFEEPMRVVDGHFQRPQQPGASTTPTPQAWARYRRPSA